MDYSSFQTLKSLSFGIFTNEEIRNLSVLDIRNTEILDPLGNPALDGLHDLRLGPNEKDELCLTCNLNFFKCPGHPGHITLPVPVYNPVFFPQLYEILCGTCLNCHRLVAVESQLCLVRYQLQALDYGLVNMVEELAEIITNDCVRITEIDARLHDKLEEAVQGLTKDDKKQTKSVFEYRREIRRNTIKKMKDASKCPHCNMTRKKLAAKSDMRIIYSENKRVHSLTLSSENYSEQKEKEILPKDVRKHILSLWENDKDFLQHLYKILQDVSVDMFFMDLIIVPPSKFRRLNVVNGKRCPDSQTVLLNDILKDCHAVRNVLKFLNKTPLDENEKDEMKKVPRRTANDKLKFLCQTLQNHINELFDSDTNKVRTKFSKGIKQIIEKKEGIFRMNMMGKRVNYAARSVISPDPYINVNEIGIPMVFAKKLTYPEPVSNLNYLKLRQAVKNGPDIHPGATLIEYENGKVVRLTSTNVAERQAFANTLLTPLCGQKPGKIRTVHRHLRDGDMLMLNRQPTLHKPSIMAHKAKVLPGEKSLRLHYATCKSYNADFDGDEMNVHFPQSYTGQSECDYIVNVNHQYLVPKDGTPISGLIQDHIVAAVLLSMRGSFFTKDQYQQLLYSALSFLPKRLKLLPPAIMRPKKLWSGKQIVSSVILNLVPEGKNPPTVEGKAKISSKNWKNSPSRPWKTKCKSFKGHTMCESEVIIRDGELLCGVIDKAHIGPTPYSLIHVCYELYGGETSSTMLSSFARLFTHYLQYYSGFSLGVEDIIVDKKADNQREKILEEVNDKGFKASAKALEVEETDAKELLRKYKAAHYDRDDFKLKELDSEMKSVTKEISDAIKDVCMPSGLIKAFPRNNLLLMIESGAKGTSINAMQISANLGQIDLEGTRPQPMLNGSTLPSFKPYDTSPFAGGFVSGRFLTGVNPQEYFFHCMAGREGLIDTAVKTSSSGYLQRCLIKHLEGITVNYDLTVRDSDGTVIQFLYGEDGFDVVKSQMLKEKSLHLLAQNYKSTVNEEHVVTLQNRVVVNLQKKKKQIRKWNREHPNSLCRSPLIERLPKAGSRRLTVTNRIRKLKAIIMDTDDCIIKEFKEFNKRCPDPVNAYNRPDLVFGSVSEKLDEIISNYVNKNLINSHATSSGKQLSSEKFINMCYYCALRSLAEPGEPVGLLAAQSVGEPSTQMTLNTFHFAGKGEMNVTLGIPRLREILMSASPNVATPTMDLPLLDKPGIQQRTEKLVLKLNPVYLKQVLDSINVREYLSVHSKSIQNFNNYVIRFNFSKLSDFKRFLYTTPNKILYYIENTFIEILIKAIETRLKQQSSESKLVDTRKESSVFRKFTESEEDGEGTNPVTDKPLQQDNARESSDDENEDNGDTISVKSKDEEEEFEDPEDVDVFAKESENKNEAEISIKQEELLDQATEAIPENIAVSNQEKKRRIDAVKLQKNKLNSIFVFDYDFDSKKASWCEISLKVKLDSSKIDMKTLLEEVVSKALVHRVKHIKQALLVRNPNARKGCNMMIKTNGVNFLEIFKYADILDVNKVYSNNIHAIGEIYGIEAAARAIKKEIVNVFKPYGINVDDHHLSLISDYMTSSGFYRPCNRKGMEGSSSPLQAMSFETTKNFMVDAMLTGVEDKLKNPSANIIVGQLCGAGTGSFDLFTKIE